MDINLTCNQVSALMNFYMENRLNPELKNCMDMHLQKCPICRKRFFELENALSLKKKRQNKNLNTMFNRELIANLSAYIDNELNSGDNIKIKKMTITNPQTRKKLETMYKFQKLLHSAYERTKSENKFDCSKNIISALNNGTDYTTTFFTKILILFCTLVIAIIAGFIYLYF